VKRTDDFLAELETQLGAAAAGRLTHRRRRSAQVLLKPALLAAVAAAAVTAFVLAAGTSPDPERPADPPAPVAAPFTLTEAHEGRCAADGGTPAPADVLARLAVLRRAAQEGDAGTARRARADAPLTLVPMERIGPCIDTAPPTTDGSGVCAEVELDGVRSACFSLARVEALQAAAALTDDFLVAVVPDGVREVTFATDQERDTYAVVDNVVIANVKGATKGAEIRLIEGAAPAPGCGELTIESGPLPDELTTAVPLLADAQPAESGAPEHVVDLLRKAGARRAWPDQARWLVTDEDVSAWVVPVADSRFADCGDPLVDAPRAFDGPGACLIATFRSEVKGVRCVDLDDFGGLSAPEVEDGRLVFGFAPHGTNYVDFAGNGLDGAPVNGGVFAKVTPSRAAPRPLYAGSQGTIDPADVQTNAVLVLAATGELAESVTSRVSQAGIETAPFGEHPPVARSRVMYAAGMVQSARQIAELLRIQDVVPLDGPPPRRAGPDADVVVVAGDDLAP
jgi:hypothetical protein